MATFWRISNFIDLSGEGGYVASGRWHTRGKPIVYLAGTPAGALLERIVHLQDGNGKLPRFYHLLEIEAPETSLLKDLPAPALEDWKEKRELTRSLGDEWLASRETAMARVPSVIVPYTWNYLFNPEHPNAGQLRVVSVVRERFDSRLFRFGRA